MLWEFGMSKNFYLIGQNIQTSLSPLIHNKLFQLKSLPHKYELFPENKMPSVEEMINDESFGGLSITIPFKTHYFEYSQNGPTSTQGKIQFMGDFPLQSGVVNTLVK